MALPDRVLRTVRRHGMVPRGGRLLVALSGGPDSVALTLIARELERRGELVLAGVAHLNHALRDAANDDEDFCREFAARVGVDFRSETVDVRALSRDTKSSIEDAARRARYQFLVRAAAELDAAFVATGHTLDDQAETFLLRLIRGAGPRGLAGVYPVANHVVRPLIETRRADLLQYLAARGEQFRVDTSNLDESIPRNRIRHELIPALERSYSPNIVEVLARESAIAREDEDYLRQKAIESAETIVLTDSSDDGHARAALRPVCEIDVDALGRERPAIRSRIVQLALATASDRFIGFDHIQRFLAFARVENEEGAERRSGELSLPGVRAVRRGNRIALVRDRLEPFSNSFEIPLSIPGEVTLEQQGWAISAVPGSDRDFLKKRAPGPESENRDLTPVLVRADRLAPPLVVRSRRPGDRLRPAGLGGRRKKLQDYLVDRKVPRERRDFLPLVVDSEGRIVWIVGFPVAEDFRVTEPSQGVILLIARRLGGPG